MLTSTEAIINLIILATGYAFYICFLSAPCLIYQAHESEREQEMIEIFIRRLAQRISRERRVPVRMLAFIERTVPNFNEVEFQSHFRLSRGAFNWLVNTIGPRLESSVGRRVIEPHTQLLAVLWLLATPDSYRSVGLRFNMGKSSLSHCFMRVVTALNEIAPIVIKWPQAGESRRRIVEGFARKAGIREVLGAIDGTYVPIKAPKENPAAYINRKCFHGVTLQAICDNERKFIDCFVGYPSSVSDLRIFKNSDIYQKISQNRENYFDQGQFIIGDKAYCVRSWCVPPFIDRGLQNYERNFNTLHAQTRQVIERSFALLFGRFRRLRYLDMNRTDMIPSTVLAACVIHNICLENIDNFHNQFEQEGLAFVVGDQLLDNEVARNRNNIEEILGHETRNNLARQLNNQR